MGDTMSGSTESPITFLSRRRFFRWASSLAAIVGGAPLVSSAKTLSSPMDSPDGEDYYAKLGVPTIINAAGTYTTLTAACMPPEVLAAVQKSALHPVRLHELQRKAGEYIAQRLKCEGAVVTSGAAGAISLATAACLQYANNITPLDIPQAMDGMKNQVIVQRAHRYEYDRAMYLCGARVTEVVTLDDYKRACGAGNAVMTNFFNAAEDEDGIAGSAQIGREEWLRVAHEHKIPCHLDAAADMPPISNLWKYTQMGFDLVCFSGGKDIRGPQNAGLLLGRKKYTDLAQRNLCPADSVGRGMKIAKEQLVGMVAAVDWLLTQSDEGMEKESRERMAVIIEAVKDIPSVQTSIMVPELANHVPHLMIRFDPKAIGASARELRVRLRSGTPCIELNPHTGSTSSSQGVPAQPNALVVTTFLLNPGEEQIVGQQI